MNENVKKDISNFEKKKQSCELGFDPHLAQQTEAPATSNGGLGFFNSFLLSEPLSY